MGIDAEMIVRNVKAEVVTDEWLKSISWRLCESIGARHFFIQDGLPPPEYAAAYAAWKSAFETHPAYKRFAKSEPGARAAIIADIGEPPKQRQLAIERTLTHYRDEGDPDPGSVYQQDGDDIVARPGECLLSLSLFGRYYGEDYERGDILTYCAIAEWLEANIPGCEVWYGGDSSGVCASPFDEKRRMELRNHLYSREGRAYYRHDLIGARDSLKPPACSLCPGGQYCGNRHGWGAQYAAFNCGGCGKAVQTRDNGQTWETDKD